MMEFGPRDEFARELRMVQPARIAFALQPIVAVAAAAGLLAMRPWLHDFLDAMQSGTTPPDAPAPEPIVSFASWLNIVLNVVLILWVWRVAATGRSLGSPSRVPPALAGLGFVIPIGNFFLPYLGVAGSLPPDDHARIWVKRWWAAYVAQTAGQILTVGLLWGPDGLGVVGVVVTGLAGLAHAYTGERVVREVMAAHEHYSAAHVDSGG